MTSNDHSESSKILQMKQLKELIVKRSSIKGQITKFRNYLDCFEDITQIEAIDIAKLTVKLSKFECLSTNFGELQGQIEILNSENLEMELDEREGIEQSMIDCIALAKIILNKQHDISLQEERDRRNSYWQDAHGEDVGIKLPQIQISKFDGSYFRWLEFRDTFTNIIHNNQKISPVQKFHYLTSYLEGDAARVISNIELSSANYNDAWNLLCERYNNNRLLITHHLKSLYNIQPLTRESEGALRSFTDHITKNLRALASLGQPTDKWDTLIIFTLSQKLDSNTLTKWEEYRNSLDDDFPTLSQYTKFLIDRANVLESINRNKVDGSYSKYSRPSVVPVHNQNSNIYKPLPSFPHNQNTQRPFSNTKSFSTSHDTRLNTYVCIICNQNHRIYDCPTFKSKGIKERLADVAKYKLCVNCLRQGHHLNDCRMGPCRECKQRHNTLLHKSNSNSGGNENTVVNPSETISNVCDQNGKQEVILSTALIDVINPVTNQRERVRALLDCGSQSSFISKALQQKLSLNSNTIDMNVIGIGNNCANKVNESCVTKLSSINSKYSVTLSCLVLEELTGNLPKETINAQNIKLPKNIQLADPTFDQPSPILVLIGADIFWDILGCEHKSLGTNSPKLHNSKFGWLISGPMYSKQNTTKIHCNHATVCNDSSKESDIENMLTKFWELEEIPQKTILSEEESACERHFKTNVTRLNTGRFCVKLPLIDSPDCLGDSYNLAKKRFFNLERRFRKFPELKRQYVNFIKEYNDLGHLSESPEARQNTCYFLCHHAIFKDSESTKVRVVFDGSAPTSSGYSVNDILMVGPKMQDSLFSILIRARQYKYLLTGDIQKFYREILVAEEDRNLQLIVWREDESLPITILRLNTLTYGTASASYLSTRCLWQVGEECGDELIKTIIQNDFFVDDMITGSNDEDELRFILNSVSKILNTACFKLRKFKTNLPCIFENSDIDTQENLALSESSSTLGLGWSPATDTLHFPVKVPSQNVPITKRSIMSSSFQIFDPLGLLSPCIIVPKMLLQKLWQQKVNWDQPVPKDIEISWQEFVSNLHIIAGLKINRSVLCDSPTTIEMHSFSDASLSGYGACIYVKSSNNNGDVTVKLLCAKSKVTRLRPTTIPRLELCAALLAARLSISVINSIRYKFDRIMHWCDSSVVLSWLRGSPAKLKTFVANRVGEILDTTQPSSWRYVPTASNPADLISRGASTNQLCNSGLWWNGPAFLIQDESKWPILNSKDVNLNIPELKITAMTVNFKSEQVIIFEGYSKLTKLQRIMAYVKRFIFNIKNSKDKMSGILSINELNEAMKSLFYLSQTQTFGQERVLLSKKTPLSPKSRILPLDPFLDSDNLLRVGGRLSASDYTYDKIHPVLLDSSHHLTKLIFENEHLRNLHAGPQLLLATVRESVWPLKGRHLARRTVYNCMRCRRVQGKTLIPKMGDLPSQRITPDFPFRSVGLDFAGPFLTLNRKGRGAKLVKSYLCLFVCLRYKCTHIEAVSDLSKDAFVMTLRRFVARRGRPAEIFCDNGRNFVAAAKELGSFLQSNSGSITEFASQECFKFTFSPAYAPHFGGIWEAGVKSAKYHIKRVMGNTHLTFEELSTLFAQVEAILNSRPLCPLSSCPHDFLFLSPGHFIIGRPLNALPAPDLKDHKETALNRFSRLEQIRQHFWLRWQKEYISELQLRTKWRTNKSNLNVGDLVLLHEDFVPPLSWRLGRVMRLFPGSDGVSRVADINTTRGCIRRPLVRLCPLPTAEDLKS